MSVPYWYPVVELVAFQMLDESTNLLPCNDLSVKNCQLLSQSCLSYYPGSKASSRLRNARQPSPGFAQDLPVLVAWRL